MNETQQKFLEKAQKSLEVAKQINESGYHEFAVSRAYVTGGDVRRVQKLSRHANLNTLIIYEDNRINAQAQVTDLLEGLV